MTFLRVLPSCLFLCTLAPCVSQITRPSADDLLKAYERSLAGLQRSSYNQMTEVVSTGAWKAPAASGERRYTEAFVCRDSARVDVSADRRNLSSDGSETLNWRIRSIVSDRGAFPDRVVSYEAPRDESEGEILVRSDLKPKVRDLHIVSEAEGGTTPAVDGYAGGHPGTYWIPDIMREGETLSVREGMEVVNGHETYVLECDNEYGKKTLWLDPKAGFNPRKMLLLTEADDIYNSGPLKKPVKPQKDPRYMRVVPSSSVVEETVTMSSVEIEEVGGKFIITGANVEKRRQYENGESTQYMETIKRTDIDLDPDFEALGAFKMDAPRGTRVAFMGDEAMSGLEYVWWDGTVVPHYSKHDIDEIDRDIRAGNLEVGDRDSDSVDELRQTQKTRTVEIPENRSSLTTLERLILWTVGGLAIAALASGTVLYRRRSRRGRHS